jgi:hypothetical protein
MLKNVILYILILLPLFAFADSSKGKKLVKQLWKDSQEKRISKIKNYTSYKFQAVYVSGPQNRSEELKLIANTNLQSYVLSQFICTETHDRIMVTYVAETTEGTGSQLITSTARRISVFAKENGTWKWIAHCRTVPPS